MSRTEDALFVSHGWSVHEVDGSRTVSYTHLDVYKRQICLRLRSTVTFVPATRVSLQYFVVVYSAPAEVGRLDISCVHAGQLFTTPRVCGLLERAVLIKSCLGDRRLKSCFIFFKAWVFFN